MKKETKTETRTMMKTGKKKEIWIKGSEKVELYRSTEPIGSPHSLLGSRSCVKFRKTVYDARFDRTVWIQTAFDGCDSMLLASARKTLTGLGFVREERNAA